MAEQFITADTLPKLSEWLDYNLDAGCSMEQLRGTLLESGFCTADVELFLASRIAERSRREAAGLFDADPLDSNEDAACRLWQRFDVLNAFNQVALGDRTAHLLAKNPRHGIYFIAGFLADEECRSLMPDAGADLSQSRVFDEGDGAAALTGSRSSLGAGIARGATEAVRRIESRIARLTALPVAHGEGLQLLHYETGGEYRPHVDYFDPATAGGARLLAQGSQRVASVIMYLSEVEAGGCTGFPELSLEFTPLKGAALLFASVGRDGTVLPASLHAGCPVTSGEKWIATKWLRRAPYP